ncbi:MAG TPA: hypothetical protein VK071_06010 [Tissierellales bacterium]|nr:hypothetical protein [Tissierellales bacterium]
MNIQINQCELIKNSEGVLYNFYIDKKNNLVFTLLEDENITNNFPFKIDSNVLDFSVVIDKKDKVQLIYLIENGTLIHSNYIQNKWTKQSVLKLNTKSNIYKYLTLFISNGSINIFYACANLVNVNLWSIEQLTQESSQWKKKTVTSIFSQKMLTPFYIDSDSLGNIHLIFKTNEKDSSHIYYLFYNIFIKKWSQIIEKISLLKTNNIFPYLFVDSKNNIHILWSSLENKKYILKYKTLSHIGQNKFRWQTINLPIVSNCINTPIMLENNGILKIIYLKDDEIGCLNSTNYGQSWKVIDKKKLDVSSIYLLKYSSNFEKEYPNNKINNYYGTIDDNITLFFNDNHNNKISYNIKDNAENNKNNIEEKINIKHQTQKQNKITSINKSELIKFKNDILEIKKILEEILIISNAMDHELKTIKEKIINVERSKNKKGFFNFK